jgi:hypothetical protein
MFISNRNSRRKRNKLNSQNNSKSSKSSFDQSAAIKQAALLIGSLELAADDYFYARRPRLIAWIALAAAYRDCMEYKQHWIENPNITNPLHQAISDVDSELYGPTVH